MYQFQMHVSGYVLREISLLDAISTAQGTHLVWGGPLEVLS